MSDAIQGVILGGLIGLVGSLLTTHFNRKSNQELWNRQMTWNQKKDIYGTLIKTAYELAMLYNQLAVMYSQDNQSVRETIEHEAKTHGVESGLHHLSALAEIFNHPTCDAIIREYLIAGLNQKRNTAEWAYGRNAAAVELADALVRCAQADLKVIHS
jgi:hypothetical protein